MVFGGFARGRIATAAPRHLLARIASHQRFWWRWRDVTACARSDATDATYTRPSARADCQGGHRQTGSVAGGGGHVTGGGVRCGAYLGSLIRDGRVA